MGTGDHLLGVARHLADIIIGMNGRVVAQHAAGRR